MNSNTMLYPNLFAALKAEEETRLSNFIEQLKEVETLPKLDNWSYNDLMPKGRRISAFKTLEEGKQYLIDRKTKKVQKEIDKHLLHLQTVSNAYTLIGGKIQVEWKKSRMWEMNPTAEFWESKSEIGSDYYKSGSIGGCGYDKLSIAIAEVVNQSNAFLKLLYDIKEQTPTGVNREIFGYGSGYGILPRLEGGVGTSCYPSIFNKIGLEFKGIAHGKTFDAYCISELQPVK